MTDHRPPAPANLTRETRAITAAAELLAQILAQLPAAWAAIVDGLPGQPRAAGWGADPGGAASIVVCDTHDRDLTACIDAGDIGCAGRPIPRRPDPTGVAAVASDPVARDARDLRRGLLAVARDVEAVARIVERHLPRPASSADRTATGGADRGCQSCARLDAAPGVARWEPVSARVRLGDQRVDLCRWCADHARATGGLPTRRDLTDHHAGRRVRRA